MIKVGELKQNSDEWHEWRKQGIGASESNIIMGASKFMSPLQLWEQKVNGKRDQEKTGNFITDKGHRLEAKARPLFELEMGHDFPDTIAIHEHYNFLRASLDGYCADLDAVWECKFVGQDDFEKVKSGEVLEQYFPQLQHQLMVTGAKVNYLYVIADDKTQAETNFPYKTACIEVEPDLEYMEKRLIPSIMDFWTLVKEKKKPTLSDLDTVDLSNNVELDDMLTRYRLLKDEADEAKKAVDDLQKEIYKIAKHNKNICNGVKITKSKSEDKEVFDYKLFESENPIEDKYKKVQKGRITKRITFPKLAE